MQKGEEEKGVSPSSLFPHIITATTFPSLPPSSVAAVFRFVSLPSPSSSPQGVRKQANQKGEIRQCFTPKLPKKLQLQRPSERRSNQSFVHQSRTVCPCQRGGGRAEGRGGSRWLSPWASHQAGRRRESGSLLLLSWSRVGGGVEKGLGEAVRIQRKRGRKGPPAQKGASSTAAAVFLPL